MSNVNIPANTSVYHLMIPTQDGVTPVYEIEEGEAAAEEKVKQQLIELGKALGRAAAKRNFQAELGRNMCLNRAWLFRASMVFC